MKMTWMLQAIVIGGLGLAGIVTDAADAVPAAKPQTMCPVLANNPINKQFFTDYNGKRVYFCCNNCPKEFAKDPEKYIKKMQEAGITLEDSPKAEAAK